MPGSAAFLTTNSLSFLPSSAAGTAYRYDNIRLNADGHTTTTTFAYDSANELTSMTATNAGTTNFTYDAWGRTTSKTLGSYTSDYAYRYGDKLAGVTTSFPDENDVTYLYGGNDRRRERTSSGETTWYNWDGWQLIQEEDTGGTLTETYVHHPDRIWGSALARVAGSNPATGAATYYAHDLRGSTTGSFNPSKALVGFAEFTPYGSPYRHTGPLPLFGFTGQITEPQAGLVYFPYRYYAPALGRWLTRDPLGMVDGPSMYTYVTDNPINLLDPMGTDILGDAIDGLIKIGGKVVGFFKWIFSPLGFPGPSPKLVKEMTDILDDPDYPANKRNEKFKDIYDAHVNGFPPEDDLPPVIECIQY